MLLLNDNDIGVVVYALFFSHTSERCPYYSQGDNNNNKKEALTWYKILDSHCTKKRKRRKVITRKMSSHNRYATDKSYLRAY